IHGTGGFDIEIRNHTNKRVEINNKSPLVFSALKSDSLSDLSDFETVLKDLSSVSKPGDVRSLQHHVWGTLMERRVKPLLEGTRTVEQDRKQFGTADEVTVGLIDRAGHREGGVVMRSSHGYTVYKLQNDGTLDDDVFTLDRDAEGKLST